MGPNTTMVVADPEDQTVCDCCTATVRAHMKLIGLALSLPYQQAKLQCTQLGGQMVVPSDGSLFVHDYQTIGFANCSKDPNIWVPIVQGSQKPDGSYQWLDDTIEGISPLPSMSKVTMNACFNKS